MGGPVRHGAEKHQQCGEYDRPGGYAAVPAARGGDGVLHLRGGREDDRKLLKDGLLRRRRYRRPGGVCFGQLWCEKSGAFNQLWAQFADLLNYPPLSVYSNGKALPVRQFLRENPERYAPHFILQFHKGAALKFQDQSYTAPVANKIILSWDVLNSELPLDHGYFEYAKKNHATALLISGVSGIQQEENLDAKLKEIARLLEGFSQETMVYCECGPFFLKDGYGKYFKELGGKVILSPAATRSCLKLTAFPILPLAATLIC